MWPPPRRVSGPRTAPFRLVARLMGLDDGEGRDGRIDEDGLRERFGLRHTSDEAFGMSLSTTSGPCFAEHGFPAGNDLIGVPEVDLLGG